MKKQSLLPLSAFLMLLTLSFVGSASAQILPTKLKISVIDGNGNFVEGAQVTLYLTEDDYINSTNPFKAEKTDAKGKVVFKKLEPRIYFIDARTESQNNDGRGSKTDNLQEGKVNKVNVVIE